MHSLVKTLVERKLILFGFLCLAVLILYSPLLRADFKTMDDYGSIVNNDRIKDFRSIGSIFVSSFFNEDHYYRPLVSFTYLIEYHLFGLNPSLYYLTNMLIHALLALVVFFLIRALTEDEMVAFFVSLMFAVHPVQWEAVSNISGRSILLAVFFSSLSLLSFILSKKNIKNSRQMLLLSLVCFAFALLSKESAGVFPAVICLYMIFKDNKTPGRIMRIIDAALPFFIVVIVYVTFRYSLGIAKVYQWRFLSEGVLGFLTFLRSLLTAGRLFVYPYDLHFDRMMPVFSNFLETGLWITVLLWLTAAVILWKKRKQIPAIMYFFMGWVAIEFFPVAQIFASIGVQPGYISTAEHFLYGPSIGILALGVMFFKNAYHHNEETQIIKRKVFQFAVCGIIVILCLTTYEVNVYSHNEVAMFNRTVQFNPKNSRIHNSLALYYARNGKIPEAQRHFELALASNPLDARARIGLGKALIDQGKFIEGLTQYNNVQNPGKLSEILEENKRLTHKLLIFHYRNQLIQAPNDLDALYGLGFVYLSAGKMDLAIDHLKRVLTQDSGHRSAIFYIGRAYHIQGRVDAASRQYEEVLKLTAEKNELDWLALKNLGEIAGRSGNQEEFKKYEQRALDIQQKLRAP